MNTKNDIKNIDNIDISERAKKKTKTKQKHIPIDQLLKLRAKGLSTHEIAKILDCSFQNVAQRLKACYLDKEMLAYVKSNFPELILTDYVRVREHIDKKKLKKASALDLAKMQALLYKQYRLESDKSTENLAFNVKQVNDEILELEKKIAEIERIDNDI